jgi:hypothetical protein
MIKKEIHPWKFFPSSKRGKKLILGSLPPKRFTDIPQNLEPDDIDFFYGSKDNSFWDLFCIAKINDFNWRQNPETLKKYLKDNEWLVSDIILKANRNGNGAADSNLLDIEWNIEIINELLELNEIETIYFTSKWVQEKFCTHIAPYINQIPKIVTLISPSRYGLMSLNWARAIFPQLDNETNTAYRQRYYNHFLNL